jgi:serralysin
VITSGATASVAENTTAVMTVTATDADLPAQTLTYSIVGGADAAKFAINSSTGALSFATAPDYEVPTDAGSNNVRRDRTGERRNLEQHQSHRRHRYRGQ